MDDLKASLISMPRGKQPGSDGLPYEFYSAFWPQVGPLLEAAFRQAFEDTSFPGLSSSQR